MGGIVCASTYYTSKQACQITFKVLYSKKPPIRLDHQGPRSLYLFFTAAQFFKVYIEIPCIV